MFLFYSKLQLMLMTENEYTNEGFVSQQLYNKYFPGNVKCQQTHIFYKIIVSFLRKTNSPLSFRKIVTVCLLASFFDAVLSCIQLHWWKMQMILIKDWGITVIV